MEDEERSVWGWLWGWIWGAVQVALMVGFLLVVIFGVYSLFQARIRHHF